ncbi:class I SAM-dependent methyltransferase [Cohnella caldifontis]|uniref:class I SAM-dependent methyltransferase n=1 Tax=Cohnella caldifontis TaxID=3027471 RepID=UPI0023ED4498|nr:class I SAM-dependent methyltransferase [Cohnella sp. YIM B05605]
MDMLSRLGVSSAHPGGFRATRRLLGQLPASDLRILEVGCGTGRTACYLAKQGYRVTALDQHPLMLEKARKRAAEEGLDGIEWVEGSVTALPFENETFDVVFAESVTLFAGLEPSIREYYRVLKPNGRLLDREMVLHEPMPEETYDEILDYFGIDKIASVDEWMECLRGAGFRCDRPQPEAFMSHEADVDESELQDLDLTTLFDPEVGMGLLKYTQLMLAQEQYFRACDFSAVKA